MLCEPKQLEFGEYAQEIELYVYIKTRDFAEYLQYREDINLSIKDIIETSGTQLVVPANTTYFEGNTSPVSGTISSATMRPKRDDDL